jgi:hypothetical protein
MTDAERLADLIAHVGLVKKPDFIKGESEVEFLLRLLDAATSRPAGSVDEPMANKQENASGSIKVSETMPEMSNRVTREWLAAKRSVIDAPAAPVATSRPAPQSDATMEIIAGGGYDEGRRPPEPDLMEKLAVFIGTHGFATGHGDTFDDLLAELGCQIEEIRARTLPTAPAASEERVEAVAIALSMADPDERGLPKGEQMAQFYRKLTRAALSALGPAPSTSAQANGAASIIEGLNDAAEGRITSVTFEGVRYSRLDDLALAAHHKMHEISRHAAPSTSAQAALREENERLREALEFYADPETYHAIAFLEERPCGNFMDDFSEDHGHEDYDRAMPGKLARAALAREEADRGPA